eukprot:SAG22_NODE_146_length_17566_cov_17.597847_16_plen_170_part_00
MLRARDRDRLASGWPYEYGMMICIMSSRVHAQLIMSRMVNRVLEGFTFFEKRPIGLCIPTQNVARMPDLRYDGQTPARRHASGNCGGEETCAMCADYEAWRSNRPMMSWAGGVFSSRNLGVCDAVTNSQPLTRKLHAAGALPGWRRRLRRLKREPTRGMSMLSSAAGAA